MRAEILKLRNDPTANAVMAGAFTKANADYLATKLGRAAERRRALHRSLSRRRRRGAADLARRQQSECQGHATISRTPPAPILRSSTIGQPATPAASPRCATFSPRAMTSPATMPCARRKPPTLPALPLLPARSASPKRPARLWISPPLRPQLLLPRRTPRSATPAAKTAAAVPDTAGMTGAFAAATPTPAAQAANQIFHGLFQDTDRTAPVAAVVSQLWTTPNAPTDGNGAAGQPSHRDMRNLFSDPGERS